MQIKMINPTNPRMPKLSSRLTGFTAILVVLAALMGGELRQVEASFRSGLIELPSSADKLTDVSVIEPVKSGLVELDGPDDEACLNLGESTYKYNHGLWQTDLLEFVILALNSRLQPAYRPLDFYKLSLQWPPATCQFTSCIRPFKSEFTIHGLWPQYNPDTGVPPYSQNPSCTMVTPVQWSAAVNQITATTRSQLTTNWPNLKNYKSQSVNERFWSCEWERHGMCSAWPAQANSYFTATLQLKSALESTISLRSYLAGVGITPSTQRTYKVGEVQLQLFKKYDVNPEISCRRAQQMLLLWEIRFCYLKKPNSLEPGIQVDCPTPFSNGCTSAMDDVRFTPA